MEKQPERLQKILSQCGIASRRHAEELISAGRVSVNGRPAKLGDSAVPGKDRISLDGGPVRMPRERLYIAMNKPRGYVTTLQDELGRKTVVSLLEELHRRVYPVGRLDRESEGLLLLTDDGDFANAILHPRSHVPKVYRVSVRPEATEEQLIRFETGIELDGKPTAPAKATVVSTEPGRSMLELTLYEGRNREIRRMCEAVGLEVARLSRVAIGSLRLGSLRPGEYRLLEKHELTSLLKAAGALRGQGQKEGDA